MKKKNDVKNSVKPELIKSVNDDTDQVKKFILILVGVALVAIALYFVSSKVIIKDGVDEEADVEETIAYDRTDVGGVFNRPYNDYYVMCYDTEALDASLYYGLVESFYRIESGMYTLDLSNGINAAYVKDESNPNATKASELAFKGPTLIHIKDGKIEKYIESYEDMQKELEDTH